MNYYHLSSENWQTLYNILQEIRVIRVSDEAATRNFIEAVFYMVRTGMQWNELPERYGNYRSIHKRFFEWSLKGVFSYILRVISKSYDGEWISIDSTFARAHPCASGYEKGQGEREALGRSAGGFTTKIHACVDALRFILTPGNRHDITQAPDLIEGFEGSDVLADKAYDSDQFVEKIEAQGGKAVIPSKSNRKKERNYDKHTYKERHVVECFFNKIKHFRRIFSRFDKKASSYMAFLEFVSAIIWLR